MALPFSEMFKKTSHAKKENGLMHKKKTLSIKKMKVMASRLITSWQIDRETMETVTEFFRGEVPKSLQMVTVAMKLKDTYSLE